MTNLPQRGPYRQQSMLSRGSPTQAHANRRWVSHDHENLNMSHLPETLEMAGNILSRIASDAPESSGGSVRVELSPDSYGPLAETILEQPPHSALDIMQEEDDPQVCCSSSHTRSICKGCSSQHASNEMVPCVPCAAVHMLWHTVLQIQQSMRCCSSTN